MSDDDCDRGWCECEAGVLGWCEDMSDTAVRVRSRFELAACPKNGLFRCTAKSLGIKQGCLIVITEDTKVEFHDPVDTLTWIRTVSNDIAEAIDLLYPAVAYIFQHHFKCSEISVDITNYSPFQRRLFPVRSMQAEDRPGPYRPALIRSPSELCRSAVL